MLKSFYCKIAMLGIVLGCGPSVLLDSKNTAFDLNYTLESEYVGTATNEFTVEVLSGSGEDFQFSISSEVATVDVATDTLHDLSSQVITFTVVSEGVYSADFKVFRKTGEPLIHEILVWEYSTEVPDEPIISFTDDVTNTIENLLLVSDSRTDNTTGLWIAGDVNTLGKTEIVDEGFWEPIASDTFRIPINLTEGDGIKTINGKFRNIFSNESELGEPATILLKQTPPSDCDVQLQSNKINTNKVSAEIYATDPYAVNYTVTGQVNELVVNKEFTSSEVEYIYLEASEGEKTFTVTIEDIAGNVCYEESHTVEIDTSYQGEGLWVDGATFWTDTENVTLTAKFDHFVSQEPLQIRFSGSVAGPNTNEWIDYAESVPVALSTTASGSKTVFVQYRDVNGDESYLISKRIFLKPEVSVVNGTPNKDVIISKILDAESVSIAGCVETYAETAWLASFPCDPNAATVDVTYHFSDGTTLVKSATP